MATDKDLITIGRVETVSFPDISIEGLHARIDTGAHTSAMWVSHTKVEDNRLAVVFLGPEHPMYTGKTYYFEEFTNTVVFSSNGHSEERFKIQMLVCIGGRRIRARFTLADRSTQVYPVLIGRNVLKGKFVVDVAQGTPLLTEKDQRAKKLQSRLNQGEQS